MKRFYLLWPSERIFQTLSEKLEDTEDMPATSAASTLNSIASRFPLPWSAYVRLLSVKNINAREFYETEALRGGWSIRQLDRQINSQFYERTALSKNKAAMLTKGQKAQSEDRVLPEEEIKDPFVLEFLDLKDEYSESDLEEALISHLETFLMELGGDFCFLGRQKRLRVGDEWYRIRTGDGFIFSMGRPMILIIGLLRRVRNRLRSGFTRPIGATSLCLEIVEVRGFTNWFIPLIRGSCPIRTGGGSFSLRSRWQVGWGFADCGFAIAEEGFGVAPEFAAVG